MPESPAWLKSLQPGARVVCDLGRYIERKLRVGVVSKRLPGGGIEVKFRGLGCYRFGRTGRTGAPGDFTNVYLREDMQSRMPEAEEETIRGELLSRLEATKWSELNTEHLRRVVAALDGKDGEP